MIVSMHQGKTGEMELQEHPVEESERWLCELGALVVLVEEQGLVPSTHIRQLKSAFNSRSRECNTLFWLLCTLA